MCIFQNPFLSVKGPVYPISLLMKLWVLYKDIFNHNTFKFSQIKSPYFYASSEVIYVQQLIPLNRINEELKGDKYGTKGKAKPHIAGH